MNIKEINKQLIEDFPFLNPHQSNYDYSWTYLDFLPSRHKTRFIDMCKEISNIMPRYDEEEFYFVEVKEKYNELRIYTNTYIEEVEKIINSYWKGIKYYG